MSVPAFAWAIEQGEQLNLPPLARWLLAVLANRANGEMVTWPSQQTLVRWTGVSVRELRKLTAILVAAGLIGVTREGRCLSYRILREPDGSDKHRHHVPQSEHRKAAPRAGVRRTKAAPRAANGASTPAPRAAIEPQIAAPRAAHTGTTCRSTPAPRAAKTTTETESETEARVRARSEGKDSREKKSDAARSHDWLNDAVDEIAAGKRTSLAAVAVERVSGPVPEPDAVVGPEVAAMLVDRVRKAIKLWPDRNPERSPSEQVEAVRPRPPLPDVSLKGDQLRAMRERAGMIRPVQREAAE